MENEEINNVELEKELNEKEKELNEKKKKPKTDAELLDFYKDQIQMYRDKTKNLKTKKNKENRKKLARIKFLLGGLAYKYSKRTDLEQDDIVSKFGRFLQKQENNGNFFSNAMAKN